MEAARRLEKPKLRGVFHEIGFYVAVAVGVLLVATAEPGKARVTGAIFAGCVAACFGASALYHRPTWPPRARAWLARLDHAGIYLLIAGTYAPFGLIVMSRGWAIPILAIVWGGAWCSCGDWWCSRSARSPPGSALGCGWSLRDA